MAKTLIIDCDNAPAIEGYKCTVKKNLKLGKLTLDLLKVVIYEPPELKVAEQICPDDLITKFKGKKLLNASIHFYLLNNQELIPKTWENHEIMFLGTVYNDSRNHPFVLTLCKSDNKWLWHITRSHMTIIYPSSVVAYLEE